MEQPKGSPVAHCLKVRLIALCYHLARTSSIMNVHRLAVEELDLCFGEWGVDKDLEKHIRFRKRIFSECRDMMNVKVGTEEMILRH